MAIVAGLYLLEPDAPAAVVDGLWSALVGALGASATELRMGPLRAAAFPEHEGESIVAADPGSRAPAIGVGDPRCPPWIRCSYDEASRTAVVQTDRHGFAVVYTRTVGPVVAFCSRAAVLGRLPPAPDPDPSALAELVAFDHLLGTRTLYSGVSALPQGHDLLLSPSGSSVQKRFRYGDIPLRREGHAAEEMLVLLWRQAMATVLDLPRTGSLIVPLSGGLDSRLLAATAREAGAEVETFTFGRQGSADVEIGRRVAATLGAPWRAVTLDDDWLAQHAERAAELTDGHLDVVHAWVMSLLEVVPSGRMCLDGLAGDVVLGGGFLNAAQEGATTHERKEAMLWDIQSRLRRPTWQALLLPSAGEALARRARQSLSESLSDDTCDPSDPRWRDFWVLRHRIRRFTIHGTTLLQTRARDVFPYFEPRWFDALMALPPGLRAGGTLQAAFFRAGWPRMANIPWQKTGRPLPRPGLLGRLATKLPRRPEFKPASPFFEMDAAFARSATLRAFVRSTLLDSGGVDRFGCFDKSAVERLCERVAKGQERGMDRLGLLVSLVLGDRLRSGSLGRAPKIRSYDAAP